MGVRRRLLGNCHVRMYGIELPPLHLVCEAAQEVRKVRGPVITGIPQGEVGGAPAIVHLLSMPRRDATGSGTYCSVPAGSEFERYLQFLSA